MDWRIPLDSVLYYQLQPSNGLHLCHEKSTYRIQTGLAHNISPNKGTYWLDIEHVEPQFAVTMMDYETAAVVLALMNKRQII